MTISSSWEVFLGHVCPLGSDLAGRLAHMAVEDEKRRAASKGDAERRRERIREKRRKDKKAR